MLATRITATKTATIRTLITRFIDQPPCSTYLYVLTIADRCSRRYPTKDLFLQFFRQASGRSVDLRGLESRTSAVQSRDPTVYLFDAFAFERIACTGPRLQPAIVAAHTLVPVGLQDA